MLYGLLLSIVQNSEVTFRGKDQLSLVSFGSDDLEHIWLLM